MIWPFRPRPERRATITAIYDRIVAQARRPLFYAQFGVADSVEGRFEMLVLHLWLVLRRLGAIAVTEPAAKELAQMLFDHFCDDLDANLRELGISDSGVPRRMRKFGEAFYGRSLTYDRAMASSDADALAAALARNVLRSDAITPASLALAAYSRAAMDHLDRLDGDGIARTEMVFPDAEPYVSTLGVDDADA